MPSKQDCTCLSKHHDLAINRKHQHSDALAIIILKGECAALCFNSHKTKPKPIKLCKKHDEYFVSLTAVINYLLQNQFQQIVLLGTPDDIYNTTRQFPFRLKRNIIAEIPHKVSSFSLKNIYRVLVKILPFQW